MKREYRGRNFFMFYGGPLSNWYPSEFKVGGTKYNCGEQWMMHQKAVIFNDIPTASKILLESSPEEQKKLGRIVDSYDDDVWADNRYDVVKLGLTSKFKQNPELEGYLLGTSGYELVEASPTDKIWGIGYGEDDPDLFYHIGLWGENLLGKVLMDIRNDIQKEKNVIW